MMSARWLSLRWSGLAQGAELGEALKTSGHEGISSAAVSRQVESVVSETLTGEEAMLLICLRQVLSNDSQVWTVLNVPRSTNQVKDLVCREGV